MRQKALFTRVVVFTGIIVTTIFGLSAQTVQTLKGNVVDADTREPLIGATVLILDSEPATGATTDINGNFSIENVPLGRKNVQVSYMGYEPVIMPELMVTSGKEIAIEVALKQRITEMQEVVVNARIRKEQPLNSMAMVSARSFTVEETGRYAGGINDPARLVSAYAGVSVGNVQNNSIIVRGNAPHGVSWRLEGVEIPTPHHFAGANVTGGGFLTLFSSQMLANSDFFTGAFPAEYGNALAAVFDMKLRNGNSERFEHTAQVGVKGVDISSEGPISKKNRSSYLFNYRYSTFGLLSDLKLLPSDQQFRYQDLSFKFNFPTKKAGTFSLWAIAGADRSVAGAEEDPDKWELDYHRVNMMWNLYMGSIGLTHKIILGENSYLHSNASFAGTVSDLASDRLDDSLKPQPDMALKNGSATASLSSTLNHRFSPRLNLRTGFVSKEIYYDLDMEGSQNHLPGTYQPLVKEEGKSYAAELFAQVRYNLSPSLVINAGVNGNWHDVNEEFSAEPRFALQWSINPTTPSALVTGCTAARRSYESIFCR